MDKVYKITRHLDEVIEAETEQEALEKLNAEYDRVSVNIVGPKPDEWKEGMIVEYIRTNDWGFSAGGLGLINEVRDKNLVFTHPFSVVNGEFDEDISYWTSTTDIILSDISVARKLVKEYYESKLDE